MDAEDKKMLKEILKRLESIEDRLADEKPSKGKYPTRVMKKSQLVKMGFSDSWLMATYRRYGQQVAWKSGNASNSVLMFDTDELEKLRKKQCVGR